MLREEKEWIEATARRIAKEEIEKAFKGDTPMAKDEAKVAAKEARIEAKEAAESAKIEAAKHK